MKTYIAKTDAEAAALNAGKIGLLVVPFKKQPSCGMVVQRFDEPNMWYEGKPVGGGADGPLEYTYSNVLIKAPYSPGDIIRVKEAWRVGAWCEDNGEIAVDYRAGLCCLKKWLVVPNEEFNRLWEESTIDASRVYGQLERYSWEPGQSPCRWRSARQMHEWAIRTRLLCESVEGRQDTDGQWKWFTVVRLETGQ